MADKAPPVTPEDLLAINKIDKALIHLQELKEYVFDQANPLLEKYETDDDACFYLLDYLHSDSLRSILSSMIRWRRKQAEKEKTNVS